MPSPTDPAATPYVFGSSHAAGRCQFVFGDGSVRGLSPSIDTTTLGRLAARNDGQVIGPYE